MEAELDAITVKVKIARLDFFILGRVLQWLDEESSRESNEVSDDLNKEVIFFGWGEGVSKTLGWKLYEVWSSFSNEGISFPIEDLSFSNEGLSFLNEEI